MNQRQRIIKAINLLRPVLSSVQLRCPRGVSKCGADFIAGNLSRALKDLDAALGSYPEKEEDK